MVSKGGKTGNKWGDDEVEAKGDSDMEGWEGDGWDTFDSPPAPAPAPMQGKATQELSSGADFFDNIETSSSKRTQSKDPFEDFGFSKARPSRGAQKDHTPPHFTSASLFGGGDTGSKASEGGGVASNKDEGEGGWGNWNSDFDAKPTIKVRLLISLLHAAKFLY